MNKETLQALKGSIKKWENIVKYTTAKDDGIHNCSLCKLYHSVISANYLSESCLACPIYNKTNIAFCHETPYQEWSEHQFKEHYNSRKANYRHSKCKDCLTLAKEELNFLKSLLPKKVKK